MSAWLRPKQPHPTHFTVTTLRVGAFSHRVSDADRRVLAAERGSLKNKGKLANGVHALPKDVDREIASLKLKAMGITFDELSEEQARYLVS